MLRRRTGLNSDVKTEVKPGDCCLRADVLTASGGGRSSSDHAGIVSELVFP